MTSNRRLCSGSHWIHAGLQCRHAQSSFSGGKGRMTMCNMPVVLRFRNAPERNMRVCSNFSDWGIDMMRKHAYVISSLQHRLMGQRRDKSGESRFWDAYLRRQRHSMVLHPRASAKVTQYNDPCSLIAHRGHAQRVQCYRQTADRMLRCSGRQGLAQTANW